MGIIDVRSIFGVGSVRNSKRIGMVAELEDWDEKTDYDRLGMSEKYVEILGVRIHHMRIPVKPGRNVGIIIEVAALNQRLKEMGISSADQLDKNVSSRNKQMGL